MRHDGNPANFPDIALDSAKDGFYISVDRSRTILSRDSQWLAFSVSMSNRHGYFHPRLYSTEYNRADLVGTGPRGID